MSSSDSSDSGPVGGRGWLNDGTAGAAAMEEEDTGREEVERRLASNMTDMVENRDGSNSIAEEIDPRWE